MDAKQAVDTATAHVEDLFGDELDDLRLEEVELEAEAQRWAVTFSFRRGRPSRRGALVIATGRDAEAERKTLFVDDESGRVTAVRDRRTDAA